MIYQSKGRAGWAGIAISGSRKMVFREGAVIFREGKMASRGRKTASRGRRIIFREGAAAFRQDAAISRERKTPSPGRPAIFREDETASREFGAAIRELPAAAAMRADVRWLGRALRGPIPDAFSTDVLTGRVYFTPAEQRQ